MDSDANFRAAQASWQAHSGLDRLAGADSRALNQAFVVVTYSPDGKIQSTNFQFLRLFGCNLSEVIGQDVNRFLSKSNQRGSMNELWARLAGGKRHTEIGLWITQGGKEVWLESRFVPIMNASGQAEAIVQIAEDITHRLARESEEHGQISAIQATHAVAHLSLDGRVQWVNELFLEATGYQRSEVLDANHSQFLPAQERESAAEKAFWQSLKNGAPQSGEFQRVRKDGSDLWLQAVYSPILDPAARVVKIVMYATDITQEKMRQSDYQWQVTAIHKSNCVVTFDMSGAILDANELFLSETGYSLDEVRGCHHRVFVDPAQAHSSDYASFWHDLRRGQHRSGLYKRLAKDGSEIWLQATYNPIFDAGGKPVKVVKYAAVVTDERLLQAEHQGQIAAINSAQCVIAFELDGRIIDANENFLNAMGYRFAEVRGQHHGMFVTPQVRNSEGYRRFWHELALGHHRSGEYKRIAKDGREVWLQATYNPILDMNGRVFKVMKYATDITAEKLRQADYQGQIEAINKSQDVVVFDLGGHITDANERFLQTVGYERSELVGQHHSMLVDPDTAASEEYARFWQTLRSGQHHAGLYKRQGKGGKEVWIQASYNPILDLNGRPFKVVKFATDVSANVAMAEAYDEAKRQAHLDAATSLPNRAKLSSFLSTHLANSAGTLALFYVDLDHFGQVNELHGHRTGDRVLGEVADRLRRLLREDQMVARVGGDEFVIAAPGMGADVVERFCQTMMEKIASPILGGEGEEVCVGMSIGIAMAPTDGSTADELLRAADAALTVPKKNGGGTRSYFSDELNARLHGQRKLIEDMRNSFTAGDFYIEYQPRFEAQGLHMRSVEALARWFHPERGRVSPAEFIPLAEQSGLIVTLGEWILRKACEQAASWHGIGVSVNLSPVQFNDDDIVLKVSQALELSGLPAHLLELEVTEGVLLTDARRALDVLNALKAIGVKLAIDDFGTGYSSLSYLRNFPFDVIKIDRSFVRDLDAQNSSRPIVQAILALGKAIGLSVTAEGVETQSQLDQLTADGCDEIQGFLLAMPSAVSEIDAIVARQAANTEAASASSAEG
ncbi:bifunctional diguanylate cyclase/phosphodiesterase [Aquabacterium parvum]|uniref:bifunctional diguanylate cyclase/phosphodiesterase n=1 Tax=Aquabacterium parvum TaxID=70584 RepID=UPI000718C471|nr:bifunctional diguanylate cyclase/phosphodiesterase [Aquabacterium parvum]